MTARAVPVVVIVVVGVVLAVLFAGGEEGRRLRLELDNASGLIEGSPVTMGSVDVGKVDSLEVDRRGRVIAELRLGEDAVPIGVGATADIRASNLLGSKLVELDPGDASRPLPDGATIPRSRVGTPVDLQDVFDVLDADTRVRLAVLVNEAGIALTGRSADFNTLLARLPSDLDAARRLVTELDSDNDALATVIDRSDSFLSTVTPERRELGEMVTAFADTFVTLSESRDDLRATLRRAPATVRTLRSFLADLRATTVPLRPAARAIRDTAGPLDQTLAALPAFEAAAQPTLGAAKEVAPELTLLGRRATPVLRRALPLLRTLAATSSELRPASSALGLSVDDLLATIEGWSRAIQGRDGVAHYFRADVSLSTDLIDSALGKGTPASRRSPRDSSRRTPVAPSPTAAPTDASSGRPGRPRTPDLEDLTDSLPEVKLPKIDLPGVVDSLELPDPLPKTPTRSPADAEDLLDFLLAP